MFFAYSHAGCFARFAEFIVIFVAYQCRHYAACDGCRIGNRQKNFKPRYKKHTGERMFATSAIYISDAVNSVIQHIYTAAAVQQ